MSATDDLLRELIDEVRELRRVVSRADLAERESRRPDGPLFVAEAAEVLGISRSALDRMIAECPAERRPAHLGTARRRRWMWADRASLLEWAASIHAPAVRTPRRARREVQGRGITDFVAIARNA